MMMKVTISIAKFLKSSDSVFNKLIEKYGLLETHSSFDLFSSFIFHFIGQMLSNKVADVLWTRFVNLVGEVEPHNILNIPDDKIRNIGISRAKIEFIKSFCNVIINKKIVLVSLNSLSDDELIRTLTKIKGVGEWTAEMIALFSLGRENIFSFKDVALKRGIMKCHPNFKTLSKTRFEKLRKLYSPYCSYASLYFYKVNDDPNFILD